MASLKYDYYIKTGDEEPSFDAFLTYADGTAIDVTGLTVTFKYLLQGSTAAPTSKVAQIIDGAAGHVRHVWDAGETDVPGKYYAQWEIEVSPGRILTVPNRGFIEFLISIDIG